MDLRCIVAIRTHARSRLRSSHTIYYGRRRRRRLQSMLYVLYYVYEMYALSLHKRINMLQFTHTVTML